MKVRIGPYKNWIGPYQIVDRVFFWTPKREKHKIKDRIAEWLANSWVNDFCQWVDSKRKRKIKVKIERQDVWDLFVTLSHIIHPALVRFRNDLTGAPFVDDDDVPDHLKSTNAEPKKNEWDTDSNHFKRWDYVLDEMIWAFYQYTTDNWEMLYPYGSNESKLHEERMNNGVRLFAKYYRNLWD